MNHMKDLSIDLETLSLSNTARIISIGACSFDRETGAIGKTFYASLEPPETDKISSLHVSPATIKWWNEQSKEAKTALEFNRLEYESALNAFMLFMRSFDQSKVQVWANEPAFDCTILSHSLTLHKYTTPWKFYNERSYRTIKELGKDLAAIDYSLLKGPKVKHHALEDAIHQAKVIAHTYKLLKDRLI